MIILDAFLPAVSMALVMTHAPRAQGFGSGALSKYTPRKPILLEQGLGFRVQGFKV